LAGKPDPEGQKLQKKKKKNSIFRSAKASHAAWTTFFDQLNRIFFSCTIFCHQNL
jgi:hypothetical protein